MQSENQLYRTDKAVDNSPPPTTESLKTEVNRTVALGEESGEWEEVGQGTDFPLQSGYSH